MMLSFIRHFLIGLAFMYAIDFVLVGLFFYLAITFDMNERKYGKTTKFAKFLYAHFGLILLLNIVFSIVSGFLIGFLLF